jgi:hypothetical protein
LPRGNQDVLQGSAGEAALHYARVTKAANDTHADCLRIITRAEMRMADEIDRGQADGQVATQGRPNGENSQGSAVYSDLGIDHRRVSEWREVRDAGPEVVERAIGVALGEGRAPKPGKRGPYKKGIA